MDALEQSTEFTRKIEMTQIAEGGMGIETRVTDIDGVPIMEVVDDERFYDAFDWEPEKGGFQPRAKKAESDTFVLPNGLDGKIDSIFVDVDTAETT